MTRTLFLGIACAASLAACSPGNPPPHQAAQSSTPPARAASASAPMSAMGSEPASAAPISAHGVGRVTAMDVSAGTITIDHQAIPEANWPAMTMAFHAAPAVLRTAHVVELLDPTPV